MHFHTTTLLALLVTSITAGPTPGRNNNNHWPNKWDRNQLFAFDKVITVTADPGQVRNGTTSQPGQPGAKGFFQFGINIAENTICYNITLSGVTGAYRSLALTATHMHEAARGASGPPRLAFPNPVGPDERRVSYGCLTAPFRTGIPGPDGKDTGEGFHVRKIVEAPAGFFADSHTEMYPAGAVRGQLC